MANKRFVFVLLFSILVTTMMNSLDMIFHLFEGTTVHLNYVLVKITIIFLSVFLTSLLVGMGKKDGIFACVLGPTLFYIYYKVAFATINRQLFKIDEQFWYVPMHITFFLLAYWITYSILVKKRYSKNVQNIAKGFGLALMTIALDFLYLLARTSIASHGNEEIIAMTLSHAYAGILLVAFTIAFSAVFWLLDKHRWAVMGVFAGIAVYLYGIDKTLSHSIALFVFVMISYFVQNKVIKSEK